MVAPKGVVSRLENGEVDNIGVQVRVLAVTAITVLAGSKMLKNQKLVVVV